MKAIEIENMKQLRAARHQLKADADAIEGLIKGQIDAIENRFKPVTNAYNFLMKPSSDGVGVIGNALMSGAKTIMPYFLTGLLAGRKRGMLGAATAVGGDLLMKNLGNIDFKKAISFVGGLGSLFKHKAKSKEKGKTARSQDLTDWESDIYHS